ncbi:MAG: polyprenyl synthetase family protein [Nitrospiraceae bacterium]|nr:polyprenyl synthetase family protein [Nitrospiraceae bacterium]
MDLKAYIEDRKNIVDGFIESYFSTQPVRPGALQQSIVYSLSAGGKRIRPVLCMAAYEIFGGRPKDVAGFATALEFIHTYSLIHDDLPAMDDDDLRRGKPTNHKVFGEGMAILAGDALLTEAFSLITDPSINQLQLKASSIVKLAREISIASGAHGMVGGQAQDLLSEDAEPDEDTLSFIHHHKTAALITASVRSGGILAMADEQAMTRLTRYGNSIGLAFQVTDDILDVEGTTEQLGKPKGSDEKMKKMTYPKLYGIEESRRKAQALVDSAVEALSVFDSKADPLREIARYLLIRQS